ncbi:AcrR family transcriptional regulator [Sphingomonas zeicaulis]|uniref:TetR/AcrR family transcriptional regulator n=1 Tax=Sphingomonas zeicaulis TaxID=1632740 RepID=UPI003D1F1163
MLAAAETLLDNGKAEFSMRDLAAAADVSFATPFNQFGSKLAIMRALSARRIATMHDRLAASALPAPAPQRVMTAVRIAVAVMTEAPAVNRAVMGAIGAPGAEGGDTLERSRAYWAAALGDAAAGLEVPMLPELLAIAFRGALSFWTAGEIDEAELLRMAQAAAAGLLLGFVCEADRTALITLVARESAPISTS